MPKLTMTNDKQIETRNSYTKIDGKIMVSVEGKELPSLAVLGEALEAATELFEQKIKDSYKVVPPRVETPVAQPYASS